MENGSEKRKNGVRSGKSSTKRKTDSEMRNNDSGEQITGIRKLLPLLTE